MELRNYGPAADAAGTGAGGWRRDGRRLTPLARGLDEGPPEMRRERWLVDDRRLTPLARGLDEGPPEMRRERWLVDDRRLTPLARGLDEGSPEMRRERGGGMTGG